MKLPPSRIFLVLFTVFLCSCGQDKVNNLVSGYEPLFQDTVLIIESGADVRSSAPIAENYTNESPPRYFMRYSFAGFSTEIPEVTVTCQYVGRAVTDQSPISKIDVYVISLKPGDAEEVRVATLYNGEEKVVIEHKSITILLTERPSQD